MTKLDHLIGEKCTVHMNLHKMLYTLKINCYVRKENGENYFFTDKNELREGETLTKTSRVVAHLEDCLIQPFKFHVNETSRQKVIKEKCRSVHAWITGRFLGYKKLNKEDYIFSHPLSYNPYKSPNYYYILPHGEIHPVRECNSIDLLYFENKSKKAYSVLGKDNSKLAYKFLKKEKI